MKTFALRVEDDRAAYRSDEAARPGGVCGCTVEAWITATTANSTAVGRIIHHHILVTVGNARWITIPDVVGSTPPVHDRVWSSACSLFPQPHGMSEFMPGNFLQKCPIIGSGRVIHILRRVTRYSG